ncbi:MAG: prepilin peptidase [Deltaproteobacteria bacterium]|jgi:leader peptidase (prepilin peptidase)/N-methyltransferase|nr:prepilin peptidase [Deltaproteobacteria bacterium]
MQLTGATQLTLSVFVFFFGLAMGSFLNVVIHRLPRDDVSVSKPRRSFCPNCLARLGWRDNIPLLSFVLLRGRCRECGNPISWRYPLVELLCALLALSIFTTEGFGFGFLFYYCFALALVAVAFIDLELMVIPDLLVFPTMLLGFVSSVVSPTPLLTGEHLWDLLLAHGWPRPLASLSGAVAGALLGFFCLFFAAWVYERRRGRKGLGEGDPPLLAMIGAFLGWHSVFPVLFISSLLALVAVFALIFAGKLPRAKKGEGGPPIPFGPFLSLAAIVWLFYGQSIEHWYFRFMGI